jgi:CRISPR-associated protein Cas1
MATLYVTEPGARIEKEYHRLVVTKEDETLVAVAALEVTGVVIVGNVGLTTPAIAFLLEREIPVVFLSSHGKLRGRLVGAAARNLALRHQQYQRARDPGFGLSISRAMVRGKLENSATLARRLARTRSATISAEMLGQIQAARDAVAGTSDLATLRGVEGAGARAYLAVWRAALQHDFGFVRRARRPPPDPINALLSLGYTLLAENLFAAIEIVGLDPYDGFYHADQYGRPALALDLMEEFRGIIVDSMVLNVINREIITARDFQAAQDADDGVLLNRHGLKKFFHHYGARLRTLVKHPFYGKRWTYQKCFEAQARLLRAVIEGKRPVYVPFRAY